MIGGSIVTPPLMVAPFAGVDDKHFLFTINLPSHEHHGISLKVFQLALGALYFGFHVNPIPRRHYIRP